MPAAQTRPGLLVGVLAFGGIVVALNQTIVIPLIPRLPDLLHAPAADTAWVVTVTLLAGAIATPTVGRLGDMYGKHRMLLLCLGLLIAGSVVVALSDSLGPVVIGRALQGLSAGVIALGISIMRDELPPERLGSATAVMSGSLGFGGALGLPAAALLAELTDWHAMFWVSAGLATVAAALVMVLVPVSSQRSGGRFDLVGAVGLSIALTCLLLGVSQGASWGWSSGATLGTFAAAVLVLVAWGFWELRTPRPLVDLRTTVRRQVLLTNIASAVFGFAMFAMSLVVPQLIQLPVVTGYGFGLGMLAVGLVMAPGGLMMMLMAPVSARISRLRGPKTTLMIGALVVSVGYALGIVLMSEVWQLVLVTCLISGGVGLAYGAMPTLVMGATPIAQTAAANSLNTLMRSIGTSVASAVAGVLLAVLTVPLGTAAVPSRFGFQIVLAIGAGAALVALAIAAFLPGRDPDPRTPVPHGEQRRVAARGALPAGS